MIDSSTQKSIWDKRAKDNAAFWVLTEKKQWNDELFFMRGVEDVQKYATPFFSSMPTKQMTALDIGCGLGRLTRALQPFFKRIIGTDISSEMTTQAKVKTPSIEFIPSDSRNLKIPSNTIDYVFSFITFQHFPSKQYVLDSFKEVKRVLAKGGKAQIQIRGTPGYKFGNLRWWMAFNRLWVGIITIKGVPLPILGIFGWRHSLLGAAFKEKEIKQQLLAMGLKVETWHENKRHLWVYLTK